MVSESWEFRSRESNPLSYPKLPTFLQEENHLPRTVLPACTIWPPQKSVALWELPLVLLLRTLKTATAESKPYVGLSKRRVVF